MTVENILPQFFPQIHRSGYPSCRFSDKCSVLPNVVNAGNVAPMALKDGKKGITAYLPPDLLKRVKIYGLMSDKMLTDMVIEALTEYLDNKGVPPVQISGDSKIQK